MRERKEALLKKYYEGNTTLAEEKELRALLSLTRGGFEPEKEFFHGLEALKLMEPEARPTPNARWETRLWHKVAAVMVVFLGLIFLFFDQQSKKEEALAYAQVMEAFTLIQENMHKGTTSLEALEDIKHLNKTNELFNITEKEEK